MDRLDKELGHYFKTYQDIDAMKLHLLMQILNMKLDENIEFRDGQVCVCGEPMLSLERLPELMNNGNMQRLQAEYQQLEQEFLDEKARFLKNPDDDSDFLAVSIRKNEAQKALQQLEKDILKLTLQFVKDSVECNLMPRQRKACELLSKGDYEGANDILDMDEIRADIAHEEQLAEQVTDRLVFRVSEMLQKIDILATMVGDSIRFDRMIGIYEETVTLEERWNLEKTAMRQYVTYLYNQNDFQRGIPVARRYLSHMQLLEVLSDIWDAQNNLAILLKNNGQPKEAEVLYREALDTCRELAEQNPGAYRSDVVKICNNLADLLSDNGQPKEAEVLYREALKIRRDLAEQNLGAYRRDVAETCNNLAILLKNNGQPKEAEVFYREALNIRRDLAEQNPGVYRPAYANTCYYFAVFLFDECHDISGAREFFEKALSIYQQLPHCAEKATRVQSFLEECF